MAWTGEGCWWTLWRPKSDGQLHGREIKKANPWLLNAWICITAAAVSNISFMYLEICYIEHVKMEKKSMQADCCNVGIHQHSAKLHYNETVAWQLRHNSFKHCIKWIRTVLGAVYINKVMLLIVNSSTALLRDVFLWHMQKVKVTTLWNFSLCPHLFIICSLDACAKNLVFQNNVYGRWSLQSCFVSLSHFDLL